MNVIDEPIRIRLNYIVIRLRFSAGWRSFMNKSNSGSIKENLQEGHGSYKLLRDDWKWPFQRIEVIKFSKSIIFHIVEGCIPADKAVDLLSF